MKSMTHAVLSPGASSVQALRCSPPHFELFSPNSRPRKRLEQYIAEHYAKVYGAKLHSFLPLILAMSDKDTFHGAVGLRPGSCGPLFLETYLDQPVEQTVTGSIKRPIDRNSLVEIGNLVTTQKGSSLFLFIFMTHVLSLSGYQWMVFTATPQVHKLIRRLDYEPLILGEASPNRLGYQANLWGTYYASHPKIMLVNIRDADQVLAAHPLASELIKAFDGVAQQALAHNLRDHRRLCGVVNA